MNEGTKLVMDGCDWSSINSHHDRSRSSITNFVR